MNTLNKTLLGAMLLVTSSSLVHADVRAGLIAHYPFSGNADDASGNGNHGTVTGATLTVDRNGVANSAYLFDGLDDFITVADTQALRLSGTDYTVAAWVHQLSRNVSYMDIIVGKRGACNTCGWLFGSRGQADSATEGKLWMHLSGGNTNYAASNAIITLNTWHHVAVVYSMSGAMTLYIDGLPDSTTPAMPTPDPNESRDMFIGRDSQTTQYHYNGTIDDVRIYDRALTDSEINDLFNGTSTLQRYCFGDPGSGTPCPCGNDNDGSVPESGCANGVFASGAQLIGTGVASVSADTLVLATTGLEPSNSGLYFQANNDLSPGILWGDGLQCAGGQLKRLGVRFSDASGYSDTSGYPQSISVKAGNVLPGDTKYYQCWYRNPSASPCGTDFNASNGGAVTWAP